MNDNEVFINLTVISKIASGDKLVLEHDHLLNIDTSYLQFVTRWWRGANRMEMLDFMNTVLSRAFEMNKRFLEEQNEVMIFRLTTDLKNALTGLNNLKQTYPHDKLVQSEIDVMMENIRATLYTKL